MSDIKFLLTFYERLIKIHGLNKNSLELQRFREIIRKLQQKEDLEA